VITCLDVTLKNSPPWRSFFFNLNRMQEVLIFSPSNFMRTSNCWIIPMRILRLRGNEIQRFALLGCPRVLVDEEQSRINTTNMGYFLLFLLGYAGLLAQRSWPSAYTRFKVAFPAIALHSSYVPHYGNLEFPLSGSKAKSGTRSRRCNCTLTVTNPHDGT
jgi:hypothetical protein